MANIEELQEVELQKLTEEISDIQELEQLIIDGANAKIPYIIDYPFYNEQNKQINFKKMAIKLQPVTSSDWNKATANRFRDNNTAIKIVEKSLYTKNEEPFPMKLIQKMPNGVINTLFKEIARISGVELDTPESRQLMKELMGF